jgi:linoleate 10R-lipoxygenase
MSKALYHTGWQKQIKDFYEDITVKLIRQNAFKLAGSNTYQVDGTRDVFNIA